MSPLMPKSAVWGEERSEQNFRIILPESISTSPQLGSDVQMQSHDKQSHKRPEQFGICQAESKIKKKEKKMRLLFYLSLGFYAILLVILFLKLYFTKKNRSLRLKIKTNFENSC